MKGFCGLCGDRLEAGDQRGLCAPCDRTALSAKLKDAEAELVEARAVVLRLIVASTRQGWERGESEEEAQSNARDQLANWGLDPHTDPVACAEVLRKQKGNADD